MNKVRLACYGLLGLPLAMAALPIYVQIPAYYNKQLGMPLMSTGLVLFFARLIDTLQDPFLGRVIDKIQAHWAAWMLFSSLTLAAGFAGLWMPPTDAGIQVLMVWLAAMLGLTYVAHSMLNITYLSWGSKLAAVSNSKSDSNSSTNLIDAAAWREGFGLAGVILASLLPSWIFNANQDQLTHHLNYYVTAFSGLLLLAILCLLFFAPKPSANTFNAPAPFLSLLKNKQFSKLLVIYFLNALSIAIPATLMLFFIEDQLQAKSYTAYFFAAYFISGALGLPFWTNLAKRTSVKRAWEISMLLSIACFCSVSTLGKQDINSFFLICISSGFALGADLALPPVLLADIVPKEEAIASYFGIWTLIGKLALALAGLSLSLLSFFNFEPTSNTLVHSNWPLIFVYALLPCFLKLCAFFILYRTKK